MALFKKKTKKIQEKVQEKAREEKKEEAQPILKAPLLAGPTKIASRVLIKPVITEKATQLSALGQYVFEVAPGVNKIEIKKAIKELYNVWPIKINIIKVKGKEVRYGKSQGQTKRSVKAIITLKRGEKIDLGLSA